MTYFERQCGAGRDRIAFTPETLVMAGWTGRDAAKVQEHVDELAELGVPGPSRVPLFYRMDPALLVGAAERITVLGDGTSGEVEAVLVSLADGLWVGLGSDHTDREMEKHGVAISKQLCRKVMAPVLWRYDEVLPHWDQLMLSARIEEGGNQVLYMEGPLAIVRRPESLLRAYADETGPGGDTLPVGTVMFLGAVPAIGGIRPSTRFSMRLDDPVLDRRLEHTYAIDALPIVA